MQSQQQYSKPLLIEQYSNQQMISIQQRLAAISVVTNTLETEQNKADLQVEQLGEMTKEISDNLEKAKLEILKKKISTEDENVRLMWMLGFLIFALLILVLIIFRL